MKRFVTLLCVVSPLLLLTSGCVTGRRTVSLPVHSLGTPAAASKGDFLISSVTDNRHFENKPSDPSTPSIDGDVNSLTPDQKASMIGRQRNTYGHAMGDIALPASDSVVQRTQELLKDALEQRGYHVTQDAAAPNSASVSIDQFWAWFTPGFASVSFEARVYCTLTIHKGGNGGTVVIKGNGLNRGQMASDANWALAYDRAFTDFLQKFGPEMEKAGL
ncbi:MAG TPA: hypothetical protein VGM64_19290 [Lacunisphaera sp.]|jgi:hypothetical protein